MSHSGLPAINFKYSYQYFSIGGNFILHSSEKPHSERRVDIFNFATESKFKHLYF